MTSSTSTSSQSHRLRGRPDRTPSGPRPLSSASSRSSIASSSSTLTRQPSIDTIRQDTSTAQPLHLALPAPDQLHTRRLSLVSTASQYSTYSNATTLPSIEGSHMDFDMLSVQFDELMRQLESAPVPVVASRPTVSRTTTSASKASLSSYESRPTTRFVPPAPVNVAAASSSPGATAVTKEASSSTEVFRPHLAAHHRRTSSMSTTSTLGPETNSEHFTVSAFPQPPSSMPHRPNAGTSPTPLPQARKSDKSLAVPDVMSQTLPKHASWSGTFLYIDSTKVADTKTKEPQPDLESAQHKLTKAEAGGARGDQKKRRSILFGCALYFLPIFILAVITLIIFLIARYR